MTNAPVKTPWHLWLVGVVAVLFNAIGVFGAFLASLAASLVSLIYTCVLTKGGAVMGQQMAITSAVIAGLLVLFCACSRFMALRGALR